MVDGSTGRRVPEKAGTGYDLRGKLPGYDGPENGKGGINMAYIRKTVDRWDIETNYGYGWEIEDCEYTRTEARKRLKEYQENSCGRFSVRLVKRRERKVEQ